MVRLYKCAEKLNRSILGNTQLMANSIQQLRATFGDSLPPYRPRRLSAESEVFCADSWEMVSAASSAADIWAPKRRSGGSSSSRSQGAAHKPCNDQDVPMPIAESGAMRQKRRSR